MSEIDAYMLADLMDVQEAEHDLVATALMACASIITIAMVVGLSFFS